MGSIISKLYLPLVLKNRAQKMLVGCESIHLLFGIRQMLCNRFLFWLNKKRKRICMLCQKRYFMAIVKKLKSPLILLVYFFQRMSGLSLTDLYRVRAWRLIKVNLLPLGWLLHSALWHDDMAWSPTTLKHTTPTLPQLHGKLLSFWTNLWGMREIGASKNAPINPQHA